MANNAPPKKQYGSLLASLRRPPRDKANEVESREEDYDPTPADSVESRSERMGKEHRDYHSGKPKKLFRDPGKAKRSKQPTIPITPTEDEKPVFSNDEEEIDLDYSKHSVMETAWHTVPGKIRFKQYTPEPSKTQHRKDTVSYTHLTLPTICSV